MQPYMTDEGQGIIPEGDDVNPMQPLTPASSILFRKWWVMRMQDMAFVSAFLICASMALSAKKPVTM